MISEIMQPNMHILLHYQPGTDAAGVDDGRTGRLSWSDLLAVASSRSVCNSRTASNRLATFGKSSPKIRKHSSIKHATFFRANSIRRTKFRSSIAWILSWLLLQYFRCRFIFRGSVLYHKTFCTKLGEISSKKYFSASRLRHHRQRDNRHPKTLL